jgi:hypothetical protein
MVNAMNIMMSEDLIYNKYKQLSSKRANDFNKDKITTNFIDILK